MLQIAPRISAAIDAGKSVVALETTLICHGLPRPDNLKAAFEIEAAVRNQGAEPATIGIIEGHIKVGLEEQEIERLCAANDVMKCTTRDLAIAAAKRVNGATTIASTIHLAHKAGIRILATGGLGGVHPGGELTMDVSADLFEMARSPTIIVCSGAKIILDIPRTLEVLETMSVAIVGYGSNKLPGFYVEKTEHVVPAIADEIELGRLARAFFALQSPASLIIANPPPADLSFAPDEIAESLDAAHKEAAAKDITGKDLTPFLLAALARLTDGRTVPLNIELVRRNAELAGKMASRL